MEPSLLDGVATTDGWDKELWVWTWRDGRSGSGPNRYAVVSAGKDGQNEATTPKKYVAAGTRKLEQDIVLMGGVFARAPAGPRP